LSAFRYGDENVVATKRVSERRAAMGSVGFTAPLIKDAVASGDCRSGSNVSLALGGDGGSIALAAILPGNHT